MATFKKYEFSSQKQYRELKATLIEDNSSFVELGILTENRFSVDVLWRDTEPQEWIQYELLNIEDNGSHTFLGYEFNN